MFTIKLQPPQYYNVRFSRDLFYLWQEISKANLPIKNAYTIEFQDTVKGIPVENDFISRYIEGDYIPYFLSALSCTIMVNQLIRRHFRNDWKRFEQDHKHPNLKINTVEHNPWALLNNRIFKFKTYDKDLMAQEFSDFTKYFIME